MHRYERNRNRWEEIMINALWLILIIPVFTLFGFLICAVLVNNENDKYVIK